MDELRRFFRDALPGRMAALEAARHAGDDAAVRRLAHMLRGSGGTYGLPGITAAAEAVELATPRDLSARLETLLDVLRTEASTRHRDDASGFPVAGEPAGGGRILLVDDDAGIRLLAGHVLRRAGYTVDAAADAAGALDAAARHEPDLLVLDVILGDEDGTRLAAALRSACPGAPPVVFLTSASADAGRLRDAGGAAVVAKPFDPDTLPALLAPHVRRRT